MPNMPAMSFHVLFLVTYKRISQHFIYDCFDAMKYKAGICRSEKGTKISTMELHCTLHTSMNPPLSLTYTYNRKRSRGFLEMVGQVVIGVRRSSINANSLSNQTRRSGLSSISYNFPKLSVFYNRIIEKKIQLKNTTKHATF